MAEGAAHRYEGNSKETKEKVGIHSVFCWSSLVAGQSLYQKDIKKD